MDKDGFTKYFIEKMLPSRAKNCLNIKTEGFLNSKTKR